MREPRQDARGAVAPAQIDSALNTMIYCFTVPCAQALDLLPTDYEAYRYLAAGGYIAVAACVAATG